MRHPLKTIPGAPIVAVLAFLIAACSVAACSPFGSDQTAKTVTPVTQSNTVVSVAPSSTIDLIAQQVLSNMHLNAWNNDAVSHGVVTGGLYINWKMSDPAVKNVTRAGPTGDALQNHDPQVDLFYLTALSEYRQLHPQDHTYSGDMARATNLVLADFRRYSLPKGWIYFYLLRDGLWLHNLGLINEARAIAANFYTRCYDPALGVVYDHAHSPGDYTPNHSLQVGAALIEAGQRWHQPDWVNAGEKTIDHVIAAALNTRYHLFYDSMMVSRDGHDQVQNDKSRPTTDAEGTSALLIAYKLTRHQQYLDVANQVLHSLCVSSGLWDTSRQGFFFAFNFANDSVIKNYKETRSQTQALVAVHQYNQLQQQQLQRQEQQLIGVLTDHFYQRDYHGFVYRLTPDFHLFTSKPGEGPGLEDYVTTEAMGTSLDALQQTELNLS